MSATPEPAGDAANLYVYGLMRGADLDRARRVLDFDAVDAPGAEILSVDCGALAAVASPIEAEEVLSTRRNLLRHARALERIMAAGPVLPMRFGLITAGADQIAATVEAEAETLAGMLDGLEGLAETGVKIVWDRTAVMREIVAEDPSLSRAYAALQGRDANQVHYEKIELGRRVEAAMSAKRHAEEAALAERLSAHAQDVVVHAPDDELMALKADFLADDDQRAALEREAEAIAAEGGDRLSVKLVGPAPAYNFVQVRLAWAAPAAGAA